MKQGDLFGGSQQPQPQHPEAHKPAAVPAVPEPQPVMLPRVQRDVVPEPVPITLPRVQRDAAAEAAPITLPRVLREAAPEPAPVTLPRVQREPVVEQQQPPRAAAVPAPAPAAPAAARAPPGQAPKVRVATSRVLTISELTRQLKETIEPSFGRVLVRGEVSGFKGPNPRGHLYFALKDEFAFLDTRIWQSTAARLKFGLKDGLEVIAEGSIDLYAPAGRYALIVQKIEPAGMGALALAYEQLKAKLLAEGLFGDKRKKPKRPLPMLPRRIGVVTSVTGAALRDFLKVLHRRHPRLSVLVADARVQGDGAAIEIEGGIRRLGRTNVDVIVVTRGGGSAEDLWAFNEERVARAIFDSPVPVVSAIGHEVDVTLSDFVADHRAATPSAAAEALAPVLADLELKLAQQHRRLHRAVERVVVGQRGSLNHLKARLGDPRRALTQNQMHLSALGDRLIASVRKAHRTRGAALEALEKRIAQARPQSRLLEVRARLAALRLRINKAGHTLTTRERHHLQGLKASLWQHTPKPKLLNERKRLAREAARLPALVKSGLLRQRERLHQLERRLDSLSPLKVLGRGYSITRLPDGHVVHDVAQAPPGTLVRITLEGEQELDAEVKGARKQRS